MIVENEDWLVVVPFWAAWPFETLVVPKRAAQRVPDLDDGQRDSLATILIDLTGRYDNLFNLPFPYSMGWHQAPFQEGRRTTGRSTRTSTRRSSVPPACASSWWATSCWRRPSET